MKRSLSCLIVFLFILNITGLCSEYIVPDELKGVNLALCATPTASSVDSNPAYSIETLNDGKNNVTFSPSWSNSPTNLPLDDKVWAMLTWQKPVSFNMVSLYTVQHYELGDFKIQIWQNNAWIDVNNVKNNSSTVVDFVSNEIMTTTRLRIVCLKGSVGEQSKFCRITEIEIYCAKTSKEDILKYAYDCVVLEKTIDVVDDLIFQKTMLNDTVKVEWYSKNEKYLTNNGEVFRPDNEVGNISVSLSAKVIFEDIYLYKTFSVTIKALEPDNIVVDNYLQKLELSESLNIVSDIDLAKNNEKNYVLVKWKSSMPHIITPDGVVSRSSDKIQTVVLTAMATRDNYTRCKNFTVTVLNNQNILKQINCERWKACEFTFYADEKYNYEYIDCVADVLFVSPTGKKMVQPAFWDGDNVWKVRFAPTELGNWSFTTIFSNRNDLGVHGVSGSINCVSYKGDLDIYKYGFIHSEKGKRYLTYANGKPFYYMGDCNWFALTLRTPFEKSNMPQYGNSMFKTMINTRVNQGYNAYRTNFFIGFGGDVSPQGTYNEGGFPWGKSKNEKDTSHMFRDLNSEFFKYTDLRIKYIVDSGLVADLGLDWGRNIRPENIDDYKRFSRYIIARYGAYPTMWHTSGEPLDEQIPYWIEIAKYTDKIDPYNKVNTIHNNVNNPDYSTYTKDLSWYDLSYTQSGHVRQESVDIRYWNNIYNRIPVKPFIESEAMFEEISNNPSYLTREVYWKANMCGSVGFAYSAEGIWQSTYDQNDKWQVWGDSPIAWYDALFKPAGNQLHYMKDFFEKINWWELIPNENMIQWIDAPVGTQAPCQKATFDKSVVTAYIPSGTNLYSGEVSLSQNCTYRAFFYNTRNGEYVLIDNNIRTDASGVWKLPTQPDNKVDWAVLIEKSTESNGVSMWKMDNLSDYWGRNDLSANSSQVCPGVIGNGIKLTNKGNLSTPFKTDFDNGFTVGIWIKQDSFLGNNKLIDKDYSFRININKNGNVHFALNTQNTDWYVGNPAIIENNNIKLEPNIWYYICGTYDKDIMKLYIDGKLIAQGNSAKGNIDNSAYKLIISNCSDSSERFVDNGVIYNRALGENEIQNLYNQGLLKCKIEFPADFPILYNNQKLAVKAIIQNTKKEKFDGTFLLATYKNNKLDDLIKSCEVGFEGDKIIMKNEILLHDIQGLEVRAFVLNNFENLIPIGNVKSINGGK